MVKFGPRDQSTKKGKIVRGVRAKAKTVNALSNEEIVKKSKFRPREYRKVERVLDNRGLTWAAED